MFDQVTADRHTYNNYRWTIHCSNCLKCLPSRHERNCLVLIILPLSARMHYASQGSSCCVKPITVLHLTADACCTSPVTECLFHIQLRRRLAMTVRKQCAISTVCQSRKPPQHRLNPPIEGTLFEFRFQTYYANSETLSCSAAKVAWFYLQWFRHIRLVLHTTENSLMRNCLKFEAIPLNFVLKFNTDPIAKV